jgi:hypothetical protein
MWPGKCINPIKSGSVIITLSLSSCPQLSYFFVILLSKNTKGKIGAGLKRLKKESFNIFNPFNSKTLIYSNTDFKS